MTKKSLTNLEGETINVNVDQIEFSKLQADGNYFCRFTSGNFHVFTTDPLAQ